MGTLNVFSTSRIIPVYCPKVSRERLHHVANTASSLAPGSYVGIGLRGRHFFLLVSIIYYDSCFIGAHGLSLHTQHNTKPCSFLQINRGFNIAILICIASHCFDGSMLTRHLWWWRQFVWHNSTNVCSVSDDKSTRCKRGPVVVDVRRHHIPRF